MKTYQERKEALREEAIKYQQEFYNKEKERYFRKKGKRYGLLKEFRVNCIIR